MPFFVRPKRKQSPKEKKLSKKDPSSKLSPHPPNHTIVNPASPPPPYVQPYIPRPQFATPPPPAPWSHPQPYPYPPTQQAYLPPVPSGRLGSSQRPAWKSCTNIAAAVTKPLATLHTSCPLTGQCIPGAGLVDLLSSKLDKVISCMDDEAFTGDEKELAVTYQQPVQTNASHEASDRGIVALRGGGGAVKETAYRGANQAVTTVATSTNYFSKANLYANSRLPPNLSPLRVYVPTYPLICLAAQYSQRVYAKPRGKEKDTHVESNWRTGTKAMSIKSVPVDDMNTVVFAIRGTQTFMDWAVNLNSAPTSPKGFLDDPGNLCHSGFLAVARNMIKPVARRLRQMLEEDPGRVSCSLLITGHSAGGAVASLLYCHMLSETAKSELNHLTGCFKRIHCITFGSPPVSLLPLNKPRSRERQLRKSLFMSFINEGDPVPRADRPYVKSLLELYASPPPKPATRPLPPPKASPASGSKLDLSLSALAGKKSKSNFHLSPARPTTAPGRPNQAISRPYSNIVWPVPPSTLSNAGRLVVLRVPYGADGQPNEEDVRAYTTNDDDLRGVMFGDPLMHQMKVYSRRVEVIATKAVTGRLIS